MRVWLSFVLFIIILACTTNPSVDLSPSATNQAESSTAADKKTAGDSKKLVKSPQGYVINGSTERFGGFIGDCSSDENFPLYWECQEEIGGDSLN